MADALREQVAVIMLLRDALMLLEARHPGHELLAFARTFDQTPPPADFVEQFGGAHVAACFRDTEFETAAMYNNFHRKVCEALGEPLRLFAK